MAFPAFLDTCTLFGGYLCDSFLRIAEAQTFRPLWSAGVLHELQMVLIRHGVPEEAARRRVTAMRRAFPSAEIDGYEPLIDVMTCHEKDRHVLAAAVRSNAEVLVTFNLKDFPDSAVKAYDISVVHPDDFLLDQLDLYPGSVLSALLAQVEGYRRPPTQIGELLAILGRSGIPRFADEVGRHL